MKWNVSKKRKRVSGYKGNDGDFALASGGGGRRGGKKEKTEERGETSEMDCVCRIRKRVRGDKRPTGGDGDLVLASGGGRRGDKKEKER